MTAIHLLALECGVLGLMLVMLSLRVIRFRHYHKVSNGDGGEKALEKAIRAHGNFIEYVPISLVMQGVLIWMSASVWVILILALLLVIGRFFHAVGLLKHELNNPPRFGYRVMGMRCTLIGLVLSSILLMVMALLTLI